MYNKYFYLLLFGNVHVKDAVFLRLDELLGQYIRHPTTVIRLRTNPFYQKFIFLYMGNSHTTVLSHMELFLECNVSFIQQILECLQYGRYCFIAGDTAVNRTGMVCGKAYIQI